MSKKLLRWPLKRPGPNLLCHKSTSTIHRVPFHLWQLGYLMVVGNHILGFSTTENTTHPSLTNLSKCQHSNKFQGLQTVGILLWAVGCCSLVFKGLFEAFSPCLYSYYQDTLATLTQRSPMERLYPKTAFAAASINFGPQTIFYPHQDFGNVGVQLQPLAPMILIMGDTWCSGTLNISFAFPLVPPFSSPLQ
jgi:hypothetical protein